MKIEVPLVDYMKDYAKEKDLPNSVFLDTDEVESCKVSNNATSITFKNGSVCIVLLVSGEDRISEDKEEIFYYQVQYYPKEYGCEGVEDDPFYMIYKIDRDFENITDFLSELPDTF